MMPKPKPSGLGVTMSQLTNSPIPSHLIDDAKLCRLNNRHRNETKIHDAFRAQIGVGILLASASVAAVGLGAIAMKG